MREGNPQMDPRELEAAFSLFNEASKQLSAAYAELQEQVISLTAQLEIANGALRRELDEKALLSRRLSLLLERLPAGVVELDASGVVLHMNPAAEQLLGSEVIGQSWMGWRAAHFVATPESDLWRYQGGDGVRRLSLTESEIPEAGINLLLIHDFTESWELEQALVRHQRLAAMGEMAAGLAHQLRTPLATALLYTGHLAQPGLREAERCRFAEKSLSRLKHIESLIGNMLRFVRGQAHEREQVAVTELFEEASQIVQHQFAEKGVGLVVKDATPAQQVWVNRKEMVGALVNLLENACHASCAGSTVVLVSSSQNDALSIEVRDQGEGMSAEVLEHLFDPFFTTRKEGTGLGLAIVRNLVVMYGGEVTAQSMPGQGSTLRIVMPSAAATVKTVS